MKIIVLTEINIIVLFEFVKYYFNLKKNNMVFPQILTIFVKGKKHPIGYRVKMKKNMYFEI